MGIGIVDGGLGIGFWDWAVGRSRSGWAKWKGSTEGRGSEMEEDNRHHRRHADHAIKKYKQNVKTQIQTQIQTQNTNTNTNTKHKYKIGGGQWSPPSPCKVQKKVKTQIQKKYKYKYKYKTQIQN